MTFQGTDLRILYGTGPNSKISLKKELTMDRKGLEMDQKGPKLDQ